ncbi:MAG: RNA methyltransferase [Pseudomonadota bacterium]
MAPTPRNHAKARSAAGFQRGENRSRTPAEDGWIWGRHAVLAALANPRRTLFSLHVTRNASAELPDGAEARHEPPHQIASRLPDSAVHQGFAARVSALEAEPLSAVTDPTHGLLVVLDQITDPQNVGALFRSASAFGARAVVMQDRKSPPLFGALCKAAVGTAESLAHVRVTNIADTLLKLREAGRTAIGLAGDSETSLADAVARHSGPGLVLVMGAEDKGLRERVAKSCDVLARIPMRADVESLNVSNAAAIALYEASRMDPRINPAD